MATNRQTNLVRSRRDSTESHASLWEKTYERFPEPQKDAPFANDNNKDSLEPNPASDESEGYDTDVDIAADLSKGLSALDISEQRKPWENPTKQEQIKIIINDDTDIDKMIRSLKKDLSRQGLKWTDAEEELTPWHFGLTSICLTFNQSRIIDIAMLCLASEIPFWLKLKTEKQKPMQKFDKTKKSIRRELTSDLDVSLRYGALTDLNQFYYSKSHSWTNMEDLRTNENQRWLLCLDDFRSGGYIEWVIENSELQRKKQLLISNIPDFIVVDLYEEGFDIYFNQKCNANEFEAKVSNENNDQRGGHKSRSEQNNSDRHRRNSENTQRQPQINYRRGSRPRPAQLLCPEKNKQPQQSRRKFYERYQRIGVHAGSYFPTVQFSIRIKPFLSTNNDKRNTQKKSKEILSLLIEFFLAHNISVCYGKINFEGGPQPYLFFQQDIPDFPSHIMKYSWQMLSVVGYRLQIQIDQSHFLEELFELSEEKNNPDELFYRVCVYLSRIFVLKPFININHELQHAIRESKRKRDHAGFGLIRKIHIQAKNEAYVPSVTITPTTIRIKPLKLCRTNRVLRATKQFGTALEHFILVDIRDENSRDLQSFHFGHLRSLLLDYLKHGFTLMDNHREYKYLHHSQSQLRERQFWFYHHEKDNSNISFSDAYSWMGRFDKEKNPAKYAARVALCFSTTKATVKVSEDKVMDKQEDIEIKINNQTLSFSDGCGTMSTRLRNKIKKHLGVKKDFSAVQFRYNGAKGVVSVHPHMPENIDLYIRKSMNKFESDHRCFEVCKLSAPRPLFLNRQAILLLSYRKIPDTSFLILQQQNHLSLISALLRNSDAQKLILQKTPSWFLPKDIHEANIDFIHEPFFRQLLINSCLQSTRELLNRTRIRIPPNKGRNMIGIVDEYNVLKANEVYVQYTILTDKDADNYDENKHNDDDNNEKTKILHNCKVVITKNPCHHPGDIRTFTAVNYPQLEHLKDVIVFSQQDEYPAPHAISGSDLDGDEYLVVWHEDLVPYHTENATPFNFDADIPVKKLNGAVKREDVESTILDIAEHDYLGRLSNLHLAFADMLGVDDEIGPPGKMALSTVELAGKISQEVDSGKTGYHPLNENQIKELNDALGSKRPDFMDNPNFERYKSDRVLGKLYRSSKKTLPGWKKLLRYHRHLRHLEVRTRYVDEEDEANEQLDNNDEETAINIDQSFLSSLNLNDQSYPACAAFAERLALVYRQEIMEILNLYGLSHESDLWCRNSVNGLTGEFEDTAYTELEQLATRTHDHVYLHQVSYCEKNCDQDTVISNLCGVCKIGRQNIAIACYQVCYGGAQSSEQAPILSLPWLFGSNLLQNRINQNLPLSSGLLSTAVGKAVSALCEHEHKLCLNGLPLTFKTSRKSIIGEANVDITVCSFIEILQYHIGRKKYPHWPLILSRFIRGTSSFKIISKKGNLSDEWELVLNSPETKIDDMYIAMISSMNNTNIDDKLINDYFQSILDICFEEARRTKNLDFLDISEDIMLLLQKLAINGTIF